MGSYEYNTMESTYLSTNITFTSLVVNNLNVLEYVTDNFLTVTSSTIRNITTSPFSSSAINKGTVDDDPRLFPVTMNSNLILFNDNNSIATNNNFRGPSLEVPNISVTSLKTSLLDLRSKSYILTLGSESENDSIVNVYFPVESPIDNLLFTLKNTNIIVTKPLTQDNVYFSFYGIYNEPLFVVPLLYLYNSGSNYLALVGTSADGISWTTHDIGAIPDQDAYITITYSPELSLYCMTGNYTSISSDLITWTTVITVDTGSVFNSVAWSPDLGLFCAVGGLGNFIVELGPVTYSAMISSDGLSWIPSIVATTNVIWSSICWSPELNKFCAVGTVFLDLAVSMVSSNGTVWSYGNLDNEIDWSAVCWSPDLGLFCACGIYSIATSLDGLSWTVKEIHPSSGNLGFLFSVIWHNGYFYTMSSNYFIIYRSSNGFTWELFNNLTIITTINCILSSPERITVFNGFEDEGSKQFTYIFNNVAHDPGYQALQMNFEDDTFIADQNSVWTSGNSLLSTSNISVTSLSVSTSNVVRLEITSLENFRSSFREHASANEYSLTFSETTLPEVSAVLINDGSGSISFVTDYVGTIAEYPNHSIQYLSEEAALAGASELLYTTEVFSIGQGLLQGNAISPVTQFFYDTVALDSLTYNQSYSYNNYLYVATAGTVTIYNVFDSIIRVTTLAMNNIPVTDLYVDNSVYVLTETELTRSNFFPGIKNVDILSEVITGNDLTSLCINGSFGYIGSLTEDLLIFEGISFNTVGTINVTSVLSILFNDNRLYIAQDSFGLLIYNTIDTSTQSFAYASIVDLHLFGNDLYVILTNSIEVLDLYNITYLGTQTLKSSIIVSGAQLIAQSFLYITAGAVLSIYETETYTEVTSITFANDILSMSLSGTSVFIITELGIYKTNIHGTSLFNVELGSSNMDLLTVSNDLITNLLVVDTVTVDVLSSQKITVLKNSVTVLNFSSSIVFNYFNGHITVTDFFIATNDSITFTISSNKVIESSKVQLFINGYTSGIPMILVKSKIQGSFDASILNLSETDILLGPIKIAVMIET